MAIDAIDVSVRTTSVSIFILIDSNTSDRPNNLMTQTLSFTSSMPNRFDRTICRSLTLTLRRRGRRHVLIVVTSVTISTVVDSIHEFFH